MMEMDNSFIQSLSVDILVPVVMLPAFDKHNVEVLKEYLHELGHFFWCWE